MSFDIVVAADKAWGIGKEERLPWPKLRGDLRHFKATTSTASQGKRNALVMGRKTWESKEVGCSPLPNRLNIVVSRGGIEVPANVVLARTLDEAITGHDVENTFVVGGAGLLVDALAHPDLRYIYLTRVNELFECEIFMPDIDKQGFIVDPTWAGATSGEEHEVRYKIERLHRPKPATPPPGT